MVRSLKLGQYLSHSKLERKGLIFNQKLSSDSNGCHSDHVRHPVQPKVEPDLQRNQSSCNVRNISPLIMIMVITAHTY